MAWWRWGGVGAAEGRLRWRWVADGSKAEEAGASEGAARWAEGG